MSRLVHALLSQANLILVRAIGLALLVSLFQILPLEIQQRLPLLQPLLLKHETSLVELICKAMIVLWYKSQLQQRPLWNNSLIK